METIFLMVGVKSVDFLETFLRGMETGGASVPLHAVHALKPSLEGWKPLPSSSPGSRGTSLETFLRGMETTARRPGTAEGAGP